MGEKFQPYDPFGRLTGKRIDDTSQNEVPVEERQDPRTSPFSMRPVPAAFPEEPISRDDLERNQYVNQARLIMGLLSGWVRGDYLLLNNTPRSHELSQAVSNLQSSDDPLAKHLVIGAENITSHAEHLLEMISQDAVDSIFIEAIYSLDNSKRATMTGLIGPVKEAKGWGFATYDVQRDVWVFYECGEDDKVNLADTYTEVGDGALVVCCHRDAAAYLEMEMG